MRLMQDMNTIPGSIVDDDINICELIRIYPKRSFQALYAITAESHSDVQGRDAGYRDSGHHAPRWMVLASRKSGD